MADKYNFDPDFLDESCKTNVEDYICCICQLIPYSETAIEEENCGHLFCLDCLNKWLKKGKECPFCKGTISQRKIKDKNKIVYRYLINLIVLCQEQGCKWKGTLKDYYEHLKKHDNTILEINNNNIFVNTDINFELYKYYKATVHEHPLKFLDLTMDNNTWACDGMKLPSMCLSKITNSRQSKGIKRFRCMQCNFDLCDLCMKKYYDQNFEIKNDSSNNRGLYFLKRQYPTLVHKHPLTFLDKTKDNGWSCNGMNLDEKCFSGITGFDQTKNIPRFRCEKCDFDLCENCMNHYREKFYYELNKSYKASIHRHPLKYLNKTGEYDGWLCDGKKQKGGCLSGITDFYQTKGFERFRCESCDFDLCRNCMDYYYQKNNCMIF